MGSHFGKRFINDFEHEIRVGPGDAHRGFDAKGVAVEAAFADEEAEVLATFENLRAFGGGGFFGGTILDEFNAEHETFAADFADDGMFFGELVESGC